MDSQSLLLKYLRVSVIIHHYSQLTGQQVQKPFLWNKCEVVKDIWVLKKEADGKRFEIRIKGMPDNIFCRGNHSELLLSVQLWQKNRGAGAQDKRISAKSANYCPYQSTWDVQDNTTIPSPETTNKRARKFRTDTMAGCRLWQFRGLVLCRDGCNWHRRIPRHVIK